MSAENGSASEGSSKEYQTEYCTPGPSTGKLQRRKRRRNTEYSSQEFQSSTLNVNCGDVKGVLYKEKLAAGVSQKCIKDSKGNWFTPVEFEASGDRKSWKTWRKSITCKGFPLEKLIEEGDLPDPPRGHSRKKRRKNPPRLSHQLAESQSSDDSQETFSATRKRAYQRINVLSSSSSPSSSLAASPTTPTVICDDNLGGATLSPSSPLSSSRAVPATPQPKCQPSHLKPTVILNRLPSVVSKASRHLLESPQMDPKPALRTLHAAMVDADSQLASAASALPPSPLWQRQAAQLPLSSSEGLGVEAEAAAGTSPSLSGAETLIPGQGEKELPIPAEEEVECSGTAAGAALPPSQQVEEEQAAEAPEAVLTLPRGRRQRRQQQRRWQRTWTQYNCSALVSRLLSTMRGLRTDVQKVIGMQDQLLHLEGHCRVEFRTLRDCQQNICRLVRHPTTARVNRILTRLDQLLDLVTGTQATVMAIMARLGIAPDHPAI